MRLNAGLERVRRCESTLAEILVSIDEMGLVTENGQEGFGMDVRESMMESPSRASPSRFLIVTVGGRYLALNAESIDGLATLEETGHVESPTVGGMTYGAINLADRLGLPYDQGGANTRVLLLSEREGRGSIRVSIARGLLELQQSQVLPLPMLFRGPEQHWYRGMILFARTVAFVLNTTWLLHAQESSLVGSMDQGGSLALAAVPKVSVNNTRIC